MVQQVQLITVFGQVVLEGPPRREVVPVVDVKVGWPVGQVGQLLVWSPRKRGNSQGKLKIDYDFLPGRDGKLDYLWVVPVPFVPFVP